MKYLVSTRVLIKDENIGKDQKINENVKNFQNFSAVNLSNYGQVWKRDGMLHKFSNSVFSDTFFLYKICHFRPF